METTKPTTVFINQPHLTQQNHPNDERLSSAKLRLLCSDDSDHEDSQNSIENLMEDSSSKIDGRHSQKLTTTYTYPDKSPPSAEKQTPITLDTDTIGFSRSNSPPTPGPGTGSGKSAKDYSIQFPTQRLPKKKLHHHTPKKKDNNNNYNCSSSSDEDSQGKVKSALSADHVRLLACSGIEMSCDDDDDDDDGFLLQRDSGREDGHVSFENSDDDSL